MSKEYVKGYKEGFKNGLEACKPNPKLDEVIKKCSTIEEIKQVIKEIDEVLEE